MPTLMEIADFVFGAFEKLPSGLVPLVGIGAILGMLAFHLSLPIRRRARWQEAAFQLGLSHVDEDPSLSTKFGSLLSFLDVDGFQTRSLDVLTGQLAGIQVWLLDHATGSRPRRLQTACVHRTEQLHLTPFRLIARRSLRRHSGFEVDFQDDPDFTRTFVLYGEDAEALRWLFDPALRTGISALFARLREIERQYNDRLTVAMLRISNSFGLLQLEAAGNTVALHLSRLIDPRGAADFLAVADEITRLLLSCQDAARSDA